MDAGIERTMLTLCIWSQRDLSSLVNLGGPFPYDQGGFSSSTYPAQGVEQLIPAGIRYVDYRGLPGTDSLRHTANSHPNISFTTNASNADLSKDPSLEANGEGMLKFQSGATNGNEMVSRSAL